MPAASSARPPAPRIIASFAWPVPVFSPMSLEGVLAPIVQRSMSERDHPNAFGSHPQPSDDDARGSDEDRHDCGRQRYGDSVQMMNPGEGEGCMPKRPDYGSGRPPCLSPGGEQVLGLTARPIRGMEVCERVRRLAASASGPKVVTFSLRVKRTIRHRDGWYKHRCQAREDHETALSPPREADEEAEANRKRISDPYEPRYAVIVCH